MRNLPGSGIEPSLYWQANSHLLCYLGGSAGKESAFQAGDPGLIPRLGSFPGEGIGYLYQCAWASLVAQVVKNPPAIRETRFDPWVGKIPWRRAWHPTPVFLSRESHGQRSLAAYSPWGHKESDMTEQLSTAQMHQLGKIFMICCKEKNASCITIFNMIQLP